VSIKVDEDLPRQIVDLLIAFGHHAATVVDQGWQGFADEILWPLVQAERRWLVTADEGFANQRNYPPGSHAGVILLRPHEESRRAYMELMARALDRIDLTLLAGSVIVVSPSGVRIRRPGARR
jgi:predicted nuclease of predicted toxin-antitoxin system